MKRIAIMICILGMVIISCFAQNSGGQIRRNTHSNKPPISKPAYKTKRTRTNSNSGFGTYSTQSIQNRIISVGSVKFLMIGVKGGVYNMGINNYESYERPVHKVAISSFLIGETEVTQELWECIMGTNPSMSKSPELPVEKVSWDDCQKFIATLNSRTGLSFRLPTEAEWEYAAKGGQLSRHYELWPGSENGGYHVWSHLNSGGYTKAVKTVEPNELGLYDMCGNVWEWCQDWYGGYPSEKQTNPHGPTDGLGRVIRGGSVNEDFRACRITNRKYHDQNKLWAYIGFRLALDVE